MIRVRAAGLTVIAFCLFFSHSCARETGSGDSLNILVFSKTEGYRHASIPDGVTMFRELGREYGFAVDHSENSGIFTESNLEQYDAVVFMSTTGNILDEDQQSAFKSYIQNGGGFVGVHAATDTEYEWAWYGTMIGAYFQSHPSIQEAAIEVTDRSHVSTGHLPERWVRTDEWYNFRDIQDHIQVLATLDESTYEGGENGDYHPIAWYHEFEGGKIFYTAGGHTRESYSEPLFREHLLGGLIYVTGYNLRMD